MKHLLLLALIACSSYVSGQVPPDGTTTIIVHNVGFKQAVMTLLDSGYSISVSDKDFETATTDDLHGVSISIRIKDSTAYISGAYDSDTLIAYHRWTRKMWVALEAYAHALGNADKSYAVSK